jgi:UDP-N-acetyl-D-glucosamine dehydrogenase|tara:strand:+ start:5778 stop:7082 length:1305 start_codon:yes stop_codon:yes gene_type:complete
MEIHLRGFLRISLENKEDFEFELGVVGLGYVGLPLAVETANNNLNVIGYDINFERVENINKGKSPIEDISDNELSKSLKYFQSTTDSQKLSKCKVIVISVPTPLTDYQPDLSYVVNAAKTVGENLVKNQVVILESTTYPGTTVEVLIPNLESKSGLKAGEDFFVGYSPERIDPGNEVWKFKNTPKVISGINDISTKKVQSFYDSIIDNTVLVNGTKEAEMVKLLENTYRHVNIALINELAMLCKMLDIDIWEVVNAAKTKPFGFESFKPGPGVGGHCIPVDPEYLSFKTRQIGKPVRFVELAQEINNSMPSYVVKQVNEILNNNKKILNNSKILLMGVAYKKDISDMRESPAIDIAELLLDKNVDLSYYDPHVEDFKVSNTSINKETRSESFDNYDMILVLTPHSDFMSLEFDKLKTIIFDTTGSDFINSTERI